MNRTPDTDLTRRDFLSHTSRTALAAGVGATIVAAATTTTTTSSALAQQSRGAGGGGGGGRKLGFAFVGLGNFAVNQLLPAVAESKQCRVAALVTGDPDKGKRLAAQYNVPERSIYSYETYDTITDNPDVDVIYIVLPNSMHAEYTIRGAEAGKHILCEKPMSTSVADCQRMIDACKKANRKLMIGYRVRYEPVNQTAIRMSQDGTIGRIIHIDAAAGFPLHDPSAWRLDKTLAGGGALLDIGIYSLNACRYLTGEEPVEISAMTYTPKDDPRYKTVEETCVWSMKFPSGVLTTCSTSYSYAAQNRFRVVGTEGWLQAEPATNYGGNRLSVARRWRPEPVEIQEINQFAATMDHMAECILNDKQPLTPGEEGLNDVRVIEAIYESANSGKVVKL